MREKLLDLMKSEGLKPSQLAEMLEINPAGISHILAGRNKPGFDLLQKILRRFPQINPDWLILDSNNMYRKSDRTDSSNPIVNKNLFDSSPIKNEKVADGKQSVVSDLTSAMAKSDWPASEKTNPAEIEHIVVFYSDRTFQSFRPKNE